LYVKGRILRDSPFLIKPTHGIFLSLIHTAIRALSREVKCHPVTCLIGDKNYEVETDKEGYFEIFENIESQVITSNTIKISAYYKNESNSVLAHIKELSSEVPVGLISDIDDTLLVTGVKSFFKIKVVLNTLFLNPFRRKPIEAAAEAFHLFTKTVNGKGPIIYLSNSPWNLFIYLKTFLGFNGFPDGTIILRDMGWQLLKSKEIAQRNKYIEIEKLLKAFSETNFVLVGDTGEIDFDIYKEIEAKYPDRILRIILNKAGNRKKEKMLSQYVVDHPKFQVVEGFSVFFDV